MKVLNIFTISWMVSIAASIQANPNELVNKEGLNNSDLDEENDHLFNRGMGGGMGTKFGGGGSFGRGSFGGPGFRGGHGVGPGFRAPGFVGGYRPPIFGPNYADAGQVPNPEDQFIEDLRDKKHRLGIGETMGVPPRRIWNPLTWPRYIWPRPEDNAPPRNVAPKHPNHEDPNTEPGGEGSGGGAASAG